MYSGHKFLCFELGWSLAASLQSDEKCRKACQNVRNGYSSVHLRHGRNACSEQAGPEPHLQRDLPRLPPLRPPFLHAPRHAPNHRRRAGGPVRLDHRERAGTLPRRLPIRTAASLRLSATRAVPRWVRWISAGNRRKSPTNSPLASPATRSTSPRTSSAALFSPSAPRKRSSASKPSCSATAKPSATTPIPARIASTSPTRAITADISTSRPTTPHSRTREPAISTAARHSSRRLSAEIRPAPIPAGPNVPSGRCRSPR